MTSIEALVELIVEAKSLNRNDSRLVFLKNEIEKDLEVLKILKKNSQYGEYYLSCDKNGKLQDGYLEIKILIPDTKKEEFNKIKEWLNDK